MSFSFPEAAALQKICRRVREAGFDIQIVGGAVRDIALGKVPGDFDLVSTARPEELQKLFPEAVFSGISFGVLRIRMDGFEFETASGRQERNYLDGRHPESVQFTRDFAVDVQRRDFTVNAMLCDPLTGKITDHVGGMADLKSQLIRTVGDPRVRFEEDYLRMLRAVRFAVRLGFAFEKSTYDAICEKSHLAAELAGERIREELSRILTGPFPDRALRLLADTGLLRAVLPEIADMQGVTQPPEFHPEGDVFEHTALMLRHMVFPDFQLAWSVLLHDVGKPCTRSVECSGRIRFFGHEVAGEVIARKIMERLHFSTADSNAVAGAVRGHMRMASVPDMRQAKLKKLIAAPGFPLELELHRLDCISCHAKMESFVRLLDELRSLPDVQLPEPWVRGRDLVRMGITPSPVFSRVLDETFDAQLSGELADAQAALEFAAALEKQLRNG